MNKHASPFTIHAMELGPMENFVYIIEDKESGKAIVVDPAWEADKINEFVADKGLTITDILLTHSHYDHINGIDGVLAKFDAQLHLLKAETVLWQGYSDSIRLHHGGDTLTVGKTDIEILHTPGHTPGSACYRISDNLIAGDTLFVFGCGRCDLAGGDPEQMFATLNKIKTDLPSNTQIYPGHNYAEKTTSTLAEQVDGNPFLHFDNVEKFSQYRMHDHDKTRDAPYGPITRK